LNKDKLKELIAFAKTTDLQEVIWEKKGVVVRFRRSADAVTPAPSALPAVPAGAAAEPAKAPEKMVIKSTMVGTFYRADSKSRPPLVIEGTVVAAGQTIAAVEAMKIMKDVLSPSDCKIVKALVENGHAVEYGQPLFEIEPVAADDHV
jgi:acetyl-CoA carboxylase biotin carboxyl carrier protein